MARSVHVLTAGALLAIAASGLAYAQKIPPQPVPIQPPLVAGGGLIVKTQSPVLKLVKPLTALQKVALVKAATSATPAEQSFDTPFRMNARTPYIDPYNYIAVYDAGFNPFFDPPEFLVRMGGVEAQIHFRAQTERTYLLDCSIDPEHVAQFQTYVDAFVPGSPASLGGQNAVMNAPTDQHLTFVVRKDTKVRDIEVRIIALANANWRLGTCEITPVRGT